MQIRPDEITQILKSQLADFDKRLDVSETGTVVAVGDGVAKVYGLEKAMAGELIEFGAGVQGMVLNLEDETGVVNIVCSRGLWKAFRPVARESAALIVRGMLQRSVDGVLSIVADKLEALEFVGAHQSRDFR